MSDSTQILKDQALNGEINRQIQTVIRAAAETVQRLKPTENNTSGMRHNQLRNVVSVAISAQSVEEIAAFILYQMGRSTNRRQWLYGEFGDHVVRDLMQGAVWNAAQVAQEKAVEHIKKAQHITPLAEVEKEQLFEQAYIALARQYLGYLNRLFYFAESAQEWDKVEKMFRMNEERANA